MKVLLVDGFNLIRRIYEARPEPDIDSVITASLQSLQRAMREHTPTHVVMVFENHDRTWRHLLYKDYKANRSPTPTALTEGMSKFEASFQEIGVNSFSLDSYEADDVIATFAYGIEAAENDAVILSTDKMYLQLLSSHIRIVNHFEHKDITETDVVERYGVKKQQLIDYWALVGDSSNNIKGVPGVGAKSALSLLARYDSLDEILSSSETDTMTLKVIQNMALAKRCKQLVTLKTDVELGTNLRRFRIR
jgi:protein Xni